MKVFLRHATIEPLPSLSRFARCDPRSTQMSFGLYTIVGPKREDESVGYRLGSHVGHPRRKFYIGLRPMKRVKNKPSEEQVRRSRF